MEVSYNFTFDSDVPDIEAAGQPNTVTCGGGCGSDGRSPIRTSRNGFGCGRSVSRGSGCRSILWWDRGRVSVVVFGWCDPDGEGAVHLTIANIMNGMCKHYIRHSGSEELRTDFLILQNVLGPHSCFECASCVSVHVAGLVPLRICYCQMDTVEGCHFLAWRSWWFGVKKGQGLQLSRSLFYPHATHFT